MMVVARCRQAKQSLQQNLNIGDLTKIRAANDGRDSLIGIVDNSRQNIGCGADILAPQNDVAMAGDQRMRGDQVPG